jgi:DNA-binding transcriptional ArsR family regulator
MSEKGQPPHLRLSGATARSIAGLMAPLGEPDRIAVLDALRDGEANVQVVADLCELPHANVSHHLRVLHRAGIASRRPEGRQVFYAIEDWTAWWLIELAAKAFPPDEI